MGFISYFFLIVFGLISESGYVDCWGVQVVDCRVCGDPNSALRFAFVEFTDEGKDVGLIFC